MEAIMIQQYSPKDILPSFKSGANKSDIIRSDSTKENTT